LTLHPCICGFKGALTSEPAKKKFGVDQALLAPLLKSGELADGASVEKKDFVMPMIENEVGYVAGMRIDKPVKDVAALKPLISEVFPAIEFPDFRYAQMANLRGPDLVADATGSCKHLVGKRVPASEVDVTNLEVTMTFDGAEVNRGRSTDAMGDQWQALLWLVNGAIEQGWVIEPGYVFITGALGKMIPGKPGKYVGNYGALGSLSFTIK
jgi:2-keto-4-pentenoate hydratase